MRDVNDTFKTEANKAVNKPLRLYIIEDYDGTNDLHFAEWDSDVTFDGATYTRFPINLESVAENNQGTIDAVKVSVSNVSRLIQGYLETYDLRGKKVTIKTVWADQLDDTSAYIDDIFYIDAYTADQNVVQFTLTSKVDVLGVELPVRRYSRNYCSWKFKSTECGYSGAETTCKKTKQDCKEVKNNYARFGGFPSIPSNRVYLG